MVAGQCSEMPDEVDEVVQCGFRSVLGAIALVASNYARQAVEEHIPLRRAGTSDEMAGVACFLASQEGAYITGQTIFVDGGLTLYPSFESTWSSE